MGLKKIGRSIAHALRHAPEKYNLVIDSYGWVSVKELCTNMNITKEVLDEIVETNNKRRFSYSINGDMIRANQGHSIKVDVGLKEAVPPDCLYHGTSRDKIDLIQSGGIQSMSRLHVHLSDDFETAIYVGMRHGKVEVLEVDAKTMHEDGIKFYKSENGVWLTDYVDPMYIEFEDF